MSRHEVLNSPVGEIMDLIACYQIEHGAKPKVYGDIDDLERIR